MSSSYEFWLTDDAGRKITPLKRWSFVTYSRTVQGFGAIQFGIPYRYYKELVPDIFKPDWRIDVWRSPEDGFPMRRESSFLLRKHVIYGEVEGDETIQFFGRSSIDILRRADLCYIDPTQYQKNDLADDMMVDIVNEALANNRLSVPTGEFSADASPGLGPTVEISFKGANLLDTLTDIKNQTIALNLISSANRKIYFDVVEGDNLSNGGFGYIFKAYATLRGQDRTGGGLIFSTANGNLRKPTYYEDHLDEVNTIGAIYDESLGADCDTVQSADAFLSRWNQCKKSVFVGDTIDFNSEMYNQIAKYKADRIFSGDFLNTPGGPTQPRSLYGVDWDMGDLVRAEFADKTFDAEVKVVHVSVNDNGRENIVGQTEVGQ